MLFQLEGIDHYYGQQRALTEVTVRAEAGSIGLLGPNGAGKTTLIKTLLGLLDPDRGDGTVLGHDIRKAAASIRRRVGYMPENDCFFGAMNGFDAVVYAARLSGLPRRNAIRRAHEVLDYAGLDEARYRPVQGYSTGMKQRVKLAQALVHGPELVFLDEPTNGLDPQGRDDMLAIIDDLARIPVSVVLSSHLLGDVERVCDHVLVLVAGQVKHFGPLAEFTQGQAGSYLVMVKDRGDVLAAALATAGIDAKVSAAEELSVTLEDGQVQTFWRTAQASGVQVRHFAPVQLTLEHAFVKFLEPEEAAP